MKLYNPLTCLVLLFFVSSCSLLDVVIEDESEPFSKRDLNTRLLVRAFHDDFTSAVILTADSIGKSTNNLGIQQKAIKWKINTNKASASAAFQSIPEISLVDTWVLTERMKLFFDSDMGKDLFGDATPLALETSTTASKKIADIAKTLYPEKKYVQLAGFVSDYSRDNPMTSLTFSKNNLLGELTQYLNVADTTYVTTLGSSAQTMSDLSDRIGVFRDQFQLQLEWQKELIALSWENDSVATNYLARADSLSARLDALVTIARESPETMGSIAENMRMELLPVVYGLTDGIDRSIVEIGQERDALQKFIDDQRALAVADLNRSSELIIDQTGQKLTDLIKDTSWLLILLALIFALVFGGIPFFAGFMVGKARFKKRE